MNFMVCFSSVSSCNNQSIFLWNSSLPKLLTTNLFACTTAGYQRSANFELSFAFPIVSTRRTLNGNATWLADIVSFRMRIPSTVAYIRINHWNSGQVVRFSWRAHNTCYPYVFVRQPQEAFNLDVYSCMVLCTAPNRQQTRLLLDGHAQTQ